MPRFASLAAGTLGAILALLPSDLTATVCQGRIDTTAVRASVTYDPLTVPDLVQDLAIRIVNAAAEPCRFRLAVHRSPDRAPRLGGILSYTVEDPGGQHLIDDRPAADPPVRFVETIDIPPGEARTLTLKWRIPAGQLVPPGNHGDDVELRLYAGPAWTLARRANVHLEARVEAVVDASLAGADLTGRYFYTVDFGELETGKTRHVALRVRANAGYRVILQSQNRGRLKGPRVGSGRQWFIDYTLRLDGHPVDLSAGAARMAYTAPSGGTHVHDISVVVGDTQNRRAGIYRDLLEITVTPGP